MTVCLQLNGNILYNGTPMTEFLPQRTAIYVEQEDNHLPELTVRETFDFSARCQGVGAQAGELTHPAAPAAIVTDGSGQLPKSCLAPMTGLKRFNNQASSTQSLLNLGMHASRSFLAIQSRPGYCWCMLHSSPAFNSTIKCNCYLSQSPQAPQGAEPASVICRFAG